MERGFQLRNRFHFFGFSLGFVIGCFLFMNKMQGTPSAWAPAARHLRVEVFHGFPFPARRTRVTVPAEKRGTPVQKPSVWRSSFPPFSKPCGKYLPGKLSK